MKIARVLTLLALTATLMQSSLVSAQEADEVVNEPTPEELQAAKL